MIILLLSNCTKNEFVGTWTGSNKGFRSNDTWSIIIKKDGNYVFSENHAKTKELIRAYGKWEKINENIIAIPIHSVRVHSDGVIPSLDLNVQKYDYDKTFYLRKDGGFSDKLNDLDVGEAPIYLTKHNT